MYKKLSLWTASVAAGLALITVGVAQSARAQAAAPGNATSNTTASATANTTSGVTPMPTPPPEAAPAAPKPDLTKLPPAATTPGVTFDKDITPILKASCLNCHGGAGRSSGGLNMTAKDLALKGGRKGKVVIPGHSDQSLVVLYPAGAITREDMPPLNAREKNPALTKDQIALIRAWIDQGAK
jgi:cytochrome c